MAAGILTTITAVFKTIGIALGLIEKKIELNNTSAMTENLKNQREQKEKEKDVKAIQKAVETGDVNDIRKRLSGID